MQTTTESSTTVAQRSERLRRRPEFVSVIIPARDVAGTLGDQIEALLGQTYVGEWEIIVADNGSIDRTREIAAALEEEIPRLRVVEAETRPGVAHARNVGAAAARGDLLLFCDGDDVVSPEWIDSMVEAARRCDVVGGSLRYDVLNPAKGRFSPPPSVFEPHLSFLPFATGGNLGVWRRVFDELEGFDETLMSSDDVDLSWRAQLAALEVGFAPRAVVHCRTSKGFLPTVRKFYVHGFHQPVLYTRFRSAGMARTSLVTVVLMWGWLLVSAPLMLFRQHRQWWIRRMALRVGRMAGSLRSRTIFL